MKIAFFGDSFCAVKNSNKDFDTYIKKLEKHYSAEIVHLGFAGSSIYDVMLLQVPEYLEKNPYPDVCIFQWTCASRIFHKKIRYINISTTFDMWHHDNLEVWGAVKSYYANLYDEDLDNLQYVSSLLYFSYATVKKFPESTKIINMWTMPKTVPKNVFGRGVEILPPLMEIANEGRDPKMTNNWYDLAPNHLEGDERNEKVFSMIKNAIDNYENGTI